MSFGAKIERPVNQRELLLQTLAIQGPCSSLLVDCICENRFHGYAMWVYDSD